MANPVLMKISEVLLYGGLTQDVQAVYDMKVFLEQQGIKYRLLFYTENTEQALAPLRTWRMGDRGAEKTHDDLVKFPFVTWNEHYDDWEKNVNIAKDITELQSKPVLVEKAKIDAVFEAPVEVKVP